MKANTVKKFNFVTSIITFSVILIFGIAFLTLFLKLKKPVPENYVETNAKIVRIEKELSPIHDETDGITEDDYDHRVFVEYSYNGKKYTEAEYPAYNSDMQEGGTVILYLNPANPGEFMSDPSGDFVFIIIGVVIILIGIGGIGYNIYEKKIGE